MVRIEDLERRGRLILKAKTNLHNFCRFTNNKYIEGEHLNQIYEALTDVAKGECKRLIITTPPQHGKSQAIINFILWYVSQHKNERIIYTSYGADLALSQSRRIKHIYKTDEYAILFPDQVRSKNLQFSDQEWVLPNGSSIYSVGIGGVLTGKPMTLGVIDDYVKSREDAKELSNQRTLEWYQSTFLTRRSPTCPIIIIATRWSVSDLIGTLLQSDEDWRYISFPAIREEEGKEIALWEKRYDLEFLKNTKESIGTFEWSALYQCEPTIKGGNRFNVDAIKIHDKLEWENIKPKGKYIRAWDLASSKKERSKNDPDYTVGVKGTVVKNHGLNELWIEDVVYGQFEAPARDKKIIDTSLIVDGSAVPVYVEAFGAYKDAYTTLKRILWGKSMVYKSRQSGDKEVKAAPMEPTFEAGNVHIRKSQWNEDWIKQMREFPSSKHDDMVDATAIVFNECTKVKSTFIL